MEKRGAGTILLTGGAFALSPNAEYLSLSIGKTAIRCMAEALFAQLSAKGIHIATLTVAAIVQHGSEEANAAADASGTSIRKRQEAGPGKRLCVHPREGIPPAWLCASRPPLGN